MSAGLPPLPPWAPPGARLVAFDEIKTIRCDRCRRKLRNRHADNGWNVTMRGGFAVGFLCPWCQTPAETAEAEIRDATTVYGNTADGHVTGRPKLTSDGGTR